MRLAKLILPVLMFAPFAAQAFSIDQCNRLDNLGSGKFLCAYNRAENDSTQMAKLYVKGRFTEAADGIYEPKPALPQVASYLVDHGALYYQTSGARLKDNSKLSFFSNDDTQYVFRCDGVHCTHAADGKYVTKGDVAITVHNGVIDNGTNGSCQLDQRNGLDIIDCEDRN